ncbi:hypothetical protein DESC_480284 [Desulfosarcina cetonica]|nr:hypothetical protein DESC_480284 [Desulfosarcina cetonica]
MLAFFGSKLEQHLFFAGHLFRGAVFFIKTGGFPFLLDGKGDNRLQIFKTHCALSFHWQLMIKRPIHPKGVAQDLLSEIPTAAVGNPNTNINIR